MCISLSLPSSQLVGNRPDAFIRQDDANQDRMVHIIKDGLNKSCFVIPANAGIQKNQLPGPRPSPG
jgi:hypothetical protein